MFSFVRYWDLNQHKVTQTSFQMTSVALNRPDIYYTYKMQQSMVNPYMTTPSFITNSTTFTTHFLTIAYIHSANSVQKLNE